MKAKRIPRIDIQDRIELKNTIPLSTPFVVHIDPCDTYNFRCKFCPSANHELMKTIEGRNHGPMNYGLYCQIIDSLAEFDEPVRTVRLYKEGEPLLHPQLADMVRYADYTEVESYKPPVQLVVSECRQSPRFYSRGFFFLV